MCRPGCVSASHLSQLQPWIHIRIEILALWGAVCSCDLIFPRTERRFALLAAYGHWSFQYINFSSKWFMVLHHVNVTWARRNGSDAISCRHRGVDSAWNSLTLSEQECRKLTVLIGKIWAHCPFVGANMWIRSVNWSLSDSQTQGWSAQTPATDARLPKTAAAVSAALTKSCWSL